MADRGFLLVRVRPPFVRFGNLNVATVSIITRIINNTDLIYLSIYLLTYLFSTSIAITFAPVGQGFWWGISSDRDSDSPL